ncbi:hypothetical protein FB451DRAFT_1180734 [Mycena latifolia]|nr:hypothetical protein FB451DRAFT_1180734 [Mycena latifolia]
MPRDPPVKITTARRANPLAFNVETLNRLCAENRPTPRLAPQFDINVCMLGADAHMVYFTKQQLDQDAKYEVSIPCTMCGLAVVVWGYGQYAVGRDGDLIPLHPVFKACWLYCPENLYSSGNKVAPPCICPSSAIACATVNSGCAFHVVPAMKEVRPGITIVRPPLSDIENGSEVFERVKITESAMDAIKVAHPHTYFKLQEYDTVQAKCQRAYDLQTEWTNTAYKDFTLPPRLPPPAAHFRFQELGPHVPAPRQFAPKIPKGHVYDYCRRTNI